MIPFFETALLALSLAGLILGLAKNLPPQNIVMILLIATAAGWGASYVPGVSSSMPIPENAAFSRGVYSIFWVCAWLSARGTTQTFLQPFRHAAFYGALLWMLTAALACLLLWVQGQFAAQMRRPEEFVPLGRGDWTPFFVLPAVAWLLTFPWFIRKRPAPAKTDPWSAPVWFSWFAFYALASLI